MPDLSPGSVFAGHRIESVAGRGGMGIVYRATHLALDHVVALKVISPKLARDPRFRRRFSDECRHAASLRHPNLVQIHHAGEEQGLLFVTMDLIEGTDLRGVLNREQTLEAEHAIRILDQVAGALDAAHAAGLIHRDVKPGNVLIEEHSGGEHVYLTDFGLARHIEATSGVTATGAFVGTLDYVAPEQIQGERVDARADVYSLACVLFELLTGNPPFAAREDKIEKMYAHLRDEPPRLRVMRPEVPGELDFVLERALSKQPDERHPSAGDLARAAAAALEGGTTVEAERSVATGAAAPIPAETSTGTEREDNEPVAVAEPPAAQPPVESPPPERPPPSAGGGGPTRRWGVVLAIAAGVAGVLVLFLLSGGGEDDDPGGAADQVTEQPPAGGGGDGEAPVPKASIVGSAAVPGFPVELAPAGAAVWVTRREGGEVSRIEPAVGNADPEVTSFPAGERPEGVAVGADSVWVADGGSGEVLRLGENGDEQASLPVGGQPAGAAFVEGSVWVADAAASRVFRIDPGDNEVSEVAVGSSPHGITAGEGSVWIVNRGDDSVSRIDPKTNSELATIAVGSNPKGVAVAAGQVFVTNTDSNTVSVVDPSLNEELRTIDVGDEPRGIVVLGEYVFVANGGGTVTRIDPRAGERVETIADLPPGPEGITATAGSLWVASGEGDEVTEIDPGD